jgi:hypothetical protein
LANSNIFVLVALIAWLGAAEKALSEERAAQLAIDQSLAEEKAAGLTTKQSLQAFEEAEVVLAQDLLSAKVSLTATTEKLASKSSSLDYVVIREREAQIKLEAVEEKKKAK